MLQQWLRSRLHRYLLAVMTSGNRPSFVCFFPRIFYWREREKQLGISSKDTSGCVLLFPAHPERNFGRHLQEEVSYARNDSKSGLASRSCTAKLSGLKQSDRVKLKERLLELTSSRMIIPSSRLDGDREAGRRKLELSSNLKMGRHDARPFP